jgi:hypothetical protein
MTSMVRGVLVAVGAVAATSCFAESAETREVTQEIQCMDPWDCNANTPHLGNHLYFWELREDHIANAQGIKIDGFTAEEAAPTAIASRVPLRLAVERDELVGYRLDGDRVRSNDVRFTGSLVGAEIALKGPGGNYTLRIDSITPVRFRTRAFGKVMAYQFTVLGPSGGVKDLCQPSDEPETEGMAAALLFESDRFDPETLSVLELPSDDSGPWFNVACVGSAMAKAHLARHTAAGAAAGGLAPVGVPQRTAFIKMITADYCGTGDNDHFTEAGQPLVYVDRRGLLPPVTGQLEALWTERGATCLGSPRLGPQMRSLIRRLCPVPDCTADDLASWRQFDLLSLNPLDQG